MENYLPEARNVKVGLMHTLIRSAIDGCNIELQVSCLESLVKHTIDSYVWQTGGDTRLFVPLEFYYRGMATYRFSGDAVLRVAQSLEAIGYRVDCEAGARHLVIDI